MYVKSMAKTTDCPLVFQCIGLTNNYNKEICGCGMIRHCNDALFKSLMAVKVMFSFIFFLPVLCNIIFFSRLSFCQ